jgi:hypothetical protein
MYSGTLRIKISGPRRLWWSIPAIPALRRLRQKDWEFKAILGYSIVRPWLKKL